MRSAVRQRIAAALLACALPAADMAGQTEPAPGAGEAKKDSGARAFYTGRGRFEVIVADGVDVAPALALGRSVWSALSAPMGLPAEGFSSPVTVRLVPAERWTEPAVFTAVVEPGGLVSVRLRWAADTEPMAVRRAFVQGVLLRQGVAWHGVRPGLSVPLWLEHACTAWSLVREKPALMDQFQQESASLGAPPPVRALLEWQRGAVESRGWELSALWLFLQLQSEGSFSRWGGWVRGVLGGAGSYETLPGAYAGLWADAPALDLWWQTVFRHQQRARSLPVMSAEASRAWLQDRSRWLAGRDGREVVLALDELPALRRESWIRAELIERQAQTRTVLGVLHPYYVNAALSMGRLYEAAQRGDEKAFRAALADFERDAIDGRELEDTVGAILDTAPRS